MPFDFKTKIQLFHTDSAGYLFYSKIFELVFEAYAALLEKCGASVGSIIHTLDFTMPFVHAEADYLVPLFVDDLVKIVIYVEKMGETSFVLRYDLLKDDLLAGRVKTVHVTVSKQSGEKIPLPQKIRHGLELCASS